MKAKRGGFYTMEALALVSVIVIAAIFVFSHYQRQADYLNKKAKRAAQEVRPVADAFFKADSKGRLSRSVLIKGVEEPRVEAAPAPASDAQPAETAPTADQAKAEPVKSAPAQTLKVTLPSKVQMTVPEDFNRATDWQVRLWHEDGTMRYVVKAGEKGVEEQPR